MDAFGKLKNLLVSRDLILVFPDFKKPFELTTEAANFALGAVITG